MTRQLVSSLDQQALEIAQQAGYIVSRGRRRALLGSWRRRCRTERRPFVSVRE
jgi:hypothetical protein